MSQSAHIITIRGCSSERRSKLIKLLLKRTCDFEEPDDELHVETDDDDFKMSFYSSWECDKDIWSLKKLLEAGETLIILSGIVSDDCDYDLPIPEDITFDQEFIVTSKSVHQKDLH